MKVLDADAKVGSSYSDPTDALTLASLSWQYVWTLTPICTITVQVSNAEAPVLTTDDDWLTYTLQNPITQPAGVAGSAGIEIVEASTWRWWRLKVLWVSGPGNVKAYLATGAR